MWIFAKQGLLMPSTFPRDKVPAEFLKPEYDLQIRGRVKEHLERWAEAYMAPGTYSAIQATPGMDYNFRFYCSHDDFAWAMGKSIADIDYGKFKPAAERPEYGKEGKEYHSVLNSIWSTVTRLGSPGGYWAPYSKGNPTGYKPYEYSSRYTSPTSIGSKYKGGKITQATSLFSNYSGYDGHWDEWLDEDDRAFLDHSTDGKYDSSEMDWTPTAEEEAEIVIADLKRAQIPTGEWRDSCTEGEWIAIRPYFDKEVKAERRAQRRARRQAKRQPHKVA